ncbi:MAG: hypothetical protein M0021_16685, partial [Clostridia bacterium]|nr:hypothetical protein [Clostridia bacterium]
AGAIVAAGRGTCLSKVKALKSAGVQVARTATELANMVSGHFRDKHAEQALRDGHWGEASGKRAYGETSGISSVERG